MLDDYSRLYAAMRESSDTEHLCLARHREPPMTCHGSTAAIVSKSLRVNASQRSMRAVGYRAAVRDYARASAMPGPGQLECAGRRRRQGSPHGYDARRLPL